MAGGSNKVPDRCDCGAPNVFAGMPTSCGHSQTLSGCARCRALDAAGYDHGEPAGGWGDGGDVCRWTESRRRNPRGIYGMISRGLAREISEGCARFWAARAVPEPEAESLTINSEEIYE